MHCLHECWSSRDKSRYKASQESNGTIMPTCCQQGKWIVEARNSWHDQPEPM